MFSSLLAQIAAGIAVMCAIKTVLSHYRGHYKRRNVCATACVFFAVQALRFWL